MTRRDRLWASALACVVGMCLSPLHAETAGEVSPLGKTSPVVIGHSLTLHSSVLDEDRQILIHLPGSTEAQGTPLPVIYLLDGRAHFNLTAATVDLLTVNGRMPRSMVVGIANPQRGRDFTPSETEGRPGGRADAFLDFIESELIPFVDGNFPTAPHRTLIGHSLGGSFVVHALAARPDLFQAAIAISPAIFNGAMEEGSPGKLKRLAAVVEQRDDWPFSLFITMAEGEGARAETGLDALLGTLGSNAPESYDWKFRRMEGEDHGTTVHPSTYSRPSFYQRRLGYDGSRPHRVIRRSRAPLRPAHRETRTRRPTSRGDAQPPRLSSARRGPGEGSHRDLRADHPSLPGFGERI